jgi:hypothetical protein
MSAGTLTVLEGFLIVVCSSSNHRDYTTSHATVVTLHILSDLLFMMIITFDAMVL